MGHPLDNIFWHALTGPQASIAVGGPQARRFAPGFSPIAGFADPARPDFDALAPHCRPGDRLYVDAWSGEAPGGWRIALDASMDKMVWDRAGGPDGELPDVRELGPVHAALALALAQLTRPGPFGPRTLEMGAYLGVFAGERLVAMAGERAFAAGLREVSGICTDPAFQGRGLARALTAMVIRRILARGETPFLHVMAGNQAAHAFYLRLGFRDHRRSPLRIVERV